MAHLQKSNEWQGKMVFAVASWCSSCKESLVRASTSGDKALILVAYDEPEKVERVLKKYDVKAPCVSSEALTKLWSIRSLPFTCQIGEGMTCI
jgi:hypothetical protein